MRAYDYASASEPKLSNPSEILQAIKGLRVGKAPELNGLSNSPQVLSIDTKVLSNRAIIFLRKVFNTILLWQNFPPAPKHGRVLSILKLGKDTKLPSPCRQIL
jgi:hypothetical protein